MYALVLFLHLLVQFQIGVSADDVLRIVAMDVLIPVIEQERDSLLVLTDRCAASLGIAVRVNRLVLHPFRSECNAINNPLNGLTATPRG